MWVTDSTGGHEGVISRINRIEYLCCPENLRYSPFVRAMTLFNVKASFQFHILTAFVSAAVTNIPTGGDDGHFETRKAFSHVSG